MNKSLYHAAKPIFDAACELPTQEQPEYVEQACGSNADLRALVLDLLRSQQDESAAGDVLHHAIERSMAPSDEEPGLVIDRFQLRERIGEGGFGTVWRADQQEPVQRGVALKVLKPGMDSRKIVARFKAERQALALMDHPSIAQVYDGGITQSGRPYFAMELVDGVAVTSYCRKQQLSLAARLDLFVKVCNAIQHAHQKGIIHRDIKPSNVLVTELEGAPFPKVIDFGIAKAIANENDRDTQLTEQNQIIGTPEYMAPEQLDGQSQSIDTRADVYALGVVLYELLTGSRPFESNTLVKGGLPSLLQAIRTSEPQKPSTRAATRGNSAAETGTTTRLHLALRGDLDWIVLRALDKDPGRRYESVGALADDVRRHLKNEPVAAGPPSRAYRIRKFVARNRGGVLAATLILVSLIAGLVGSSVALGWALEERERATQRFDLALDAVRDYHTGVAEDVILSQENMTALRTRLLQAPRKLYEKLEQSLSIDSRPEERTALGKALQGLASLLADVGEGKQAITTYLRAARLLRELEADSSDPVPARFERATLLGIVGRLQAIEGQTQEATATLRTALEATKSVLSERPDVARYKNHLADATAELGSVLRQQGELTQAHECWQAALDMYQQLRADSSQRVDVCKDIADIHNSMGRVALNSANAKEARRLFSVALDITEELLREQPGNSNLMTRVATCSSNLGNACSKDHDDQAAKTAYERAIKLTEKLAKKFPGVASYRHNLGNSCSALASTLAALDKFEDANQNHDRALTLLNTARSVADRRLLAQAFSNAAGFLLDHEHIEPAIERFRNAVAVYDSLLKESSDPDIVSAAASCFNNYAGVANWRGQLEEARTLYERSIKLREQALEAYPDNTTQHLNLSTALSNLGKMHFTAKRYREAIPYYTRSIAVTEGLAKQFADQENSRWWQLHRAAYWGRANCYQMSDQYKLAVDDWLRAAVIDRGKMRAPYLTQLFADMVRGDLLGNLATTVDDIANRSGATCDDLLRVGSAYLRGKGNDDFLPLALVIAEKALGMAEQDKEPETWRYLDLLANAQLHNGDPEAALTTQTRALNIAPTSLNKQARQMLQAHLQDIQTARKR